MIDVEGTHSWKRPFKVANVEISDCGACLCRRFRYLSGQVYRDTYRNRISLKTCDEEKIRFVLNE